MAKPSISEIQTGFDKGLNMVLEEELFEQGLPVFNMEGKPILIPLYLVAISLSLPFLATYYVGCSLWILGVAVTCKCLDPSRLRKRG